MNWPHWPAICARKLQEIDMSSAFESIKRGLEEAIEFAQGKPSKAIVHQLSALDIKRIRSDAGMTQEEFAMAFGISVSTLRHWERGDRSPAGPALVLLNVMEKEPGAVLRALAR
jgi:putative transcriptional regulator